MTLAEAAAETPTTWQDVIAVAIVMICSVVVVYVISRWL